MDQSFHLERFTLQSRTTLVEDLHFSVDNEDYCVTDLKLSYNLTTETELVFKVDNIFNESYQETEGYPMPGRWLWGEVAVAF